VKIEVDLDVPAPPDSVWPHLELLDRYPPWMRLVHRVESVDPTDGNPAWDVELRAKIGPFARSKRLRMARTACDECRFVRFERAQFDGRDHAEWTLSTTLTESDAGSVVTAELFYSGDLWSGGILERVLEDEIRQAKSSLLRVVTASPRR